MAEGSIMTFDLFKEELKRRGIMQSSIDSRGVAAAFDILSNGGHTFQGINKANYQLGELESALLLKRGELKEVQERIDDGRNKWRTETLKQVKYIEEFCNSLNACETAKGRDAMRIAQLFINTVDVDSKYDNTAFIIGLAQILSGAEGVPIDKLQKLNPKLLREKIEW